MSTPLLQVRVRATTFEAEGILSFELCPLPPATNLPAFTAGAHIDLHLGNGLVRSYSLLNDPQERHRYVIAVNRDAHSRGGSRYLHDELRTGSVLQISHPRNHFPLDETSPCNVFIAGGIGITPMLSMVARCHTLGTPWKLYYSARTRQHAAFVGLLESYQHQPGAELLLNFDHAPGGKLLDLATIAASLPPGAHLYCCGPVAMLDAYTKATASLEPHRVHMEYFAAPEAGATESGGYTVELQRSSKTLQIEAGQTLLDGLIAIGAEPPYSCREGLCGTCEVKVLCGTPDHRDLVLSPAEKAANDRMMVCCSGAKSERLVLDL
ncbi:MULTISPECIES: PDR/VanB family oxidoreductase [Giesbergeria]|uniref:PDR/VanB family oxidoreductase n=1 Tax=Giesbergeria sinuosa TaxID=80883 RepID=A0ABV9QGN5_9BURK